MDSDMSANQSAGLDTADPGKPESGGHLAALDVRDTTILKGLAISAIVLHNFFHAVSPARENEFVFHPGGLAVFLATVRQPALAIQALFSFFGYLGVPVFIFLSAYGLSKSHWNERVGWAQFMAGRIRKLFPIFGLVVLPWTIVDIVQKGLHPFLQNVLPQIALMLTGLTPWVPGVGLPPVGPWWFIPFILQFYAIFFLLRAITNRFGWPGLLVLALLGVALSMAINPHLAQWAMNVYETPLGRMPSICLGIAAARYPFRLPVSLALAAATVLLLGCDLSALWPLTFCAALVLTLWAYMQMRPSLRVSRSLERIGRYSVLIFLLNTIVRNQFLSFATTPGNQLLFGAVSALASFAIAATIQELLIGQRSTTPDSAVAQEAA